MDVDDPLITRYLKRSAIRRLRTPPFLHREIAIPRYGVWVLIVYLISGIVPHLRAIDGVVATAICIAALIQWIRWGRRS